MKDDSLFAFAGIWDRWRTSDGHIIESCAILTTGPNELLNDVHDRMPVMLREETYQEWLVGAPKHCFAALRCDDDETLSCEFGGERSAS